MNILNGILGDGDLSISRIDAQKVVDVAEELAWEAMDRAAQMADKVMSGEGSGE